MRLLELFHVEPADHVAATAARGPQNLVGIELQVMRAETRVDQCELLALRIVKRELPAAARYWEQFRRGLARSLFAICRVVRRPNYGRKPDAPFLIEHGIVHVGLAVPDRFISPIR
jgi:hypothetical protein